MSKDHGVIETPRAVSGAVPGRFAPGAHAPSVPALEDAIEQVIDQAPVGYVQADRLGRITHVNRRWCDMLQYTEAQMLERSIQDLIHPEDMPRALAALEHLAQGGDNFCIDKRYVRRDGATLWATSSVTALRGADGQYQGLVAVVLDVTRRKQQEMELQHLAQELSETDRRKSEFLATLAHELRNPLAPLAQALHMLRLDANAESVKRSCEIMERQLRHLVRLVDELLDVARIARGKIALRPAATPLQDVVQCALDLSAPLVRRHRHELTVRLPAEPVYLHADATRLAQVLGNLLNNAAKYTPEGGRIALEAWTRDTSAAISVRDNGVGIPPEDLPHIFDLFTQVGRSLDMAQGGLGIGLALARQLVQLHGGRISAHSEGLGRGSVFTVELPTCAAPQRTPTQSSGELPPPCQGLRVLVVDDNVDGANTLASLLQTYGHTTEVAYDGANALVQAQRFAPQAAFLDLSMPGMDGFELARQLHQRHAGIALVALTGWAGEADKARSLANGFAAHLSKPVDLAALQAILAQVAPAAQEARQPNPGRCE